MEARKRNERIFIVFLSIASICSQSIPLLINRNPSKSSQTEPEHTFPAKVEPLVPRIAKRIEDWITEHVPLFEATCVAVSAHILAFPIFWMMGWAMPWPKSPEITTIIEYDLGHWPEIAVPDKVTDIYKSQMHKFKPGE